MIRNWNVQDEKPKFSEEESDIPLVIGHSSCHSYLIEAVINRYQRDDDEGQPSAHKRQADCR